MDWVLGPPFKDWVHEPPIFTTPYKQIPLVCDLLLHFSQIFCYEQFEITKFAMLKIILGSTKVTVSVVKVAVLLRWLPRVRKGS